VLEQEKIESEKADELLLQSIDQMITELTLGATLNI
jgi:hypothetical protein